jgi:MFS transporter, DHA3 family, macrolide efflux protein
VSGMDTSGPAPPAGRLPQLHGQTGYIALMTADTVSGIGNSLATFVLTLWAYREYGSAAAIAQVTLATMIPQVVSSLWSGVLIDRKNRRALLIAANAVSAVLVLILAFLLAGNRLTLPLLYPLVGALGVLGGLSDQTLAASVSLMVKTGSLMKMNGLTQVLNVGAPVTAPLLGAVLTSFMSLSSVIVVDAISFVPVFVTIFFIAVPQPPRPAEPAGVMRDVAEGVRFLLARWSLLILIGVFAAYQFFRVTVQVLLLPMASEYWSHDASLHWAASLSHALGSGGGQATLIFGVANAIRWLGTFGGGFAVYAAGDVRDKVRLYFGCLLASGVLQALTGSTVGLVALTALLAGGISSAFIRAALFARMVPEIPAGMQGRVLSTLNLLTQLGTMLGLLLTGYLADALNPAAVLAGSGVGVVLVSAAGLIAHRRRASSADDNRPLAESVSA